MRVDGKTIDECVQQIEALISSTPDDDLYRHIGDMARLSEKMRGKVNTPHIQTEEPEAQLLNAKGIARYLQVPVYTARQMANQKGFPLIKIGKHIRADLNDVKIWARTHLNKEVDATVYESYNKECDGRIDPQKNQKENETDPSPARQKAGSRRQYGCAVGAG